MKTNTETPDLKQIYKQTLAEQLAAEKKYAKLVERISKSVITDELKRGISPDGTDIENHISRLSRAMEAVEQKVQEKIAVVDEVLIKMLKDATAKSATHLKDVQILHVFKLIFSVKVARYDSLYRMATAMDYPEYAALLEQCSKDNQNTVAYLNQLEQNVLYPETQKSL